MSVFKWALDYLSFLLNSNKLSLIRSDKVGEAEMEYNEASQVSRHSLFYVLGIFVI